MYKPIRLLPRKTNIDFLGKRVPALVLSTVVNIAAIVLVFTVGLNFGIDFRGGIAIEAKSLKGDADLAETRRITSGLGLGEVSLQEFGASDTILIRIQRQEGGSECVANASRLLAKAMGQGWGVRPVADAQSGNLEMTAPSRIGEEQARAAARALGLPDNLVQSGPTPTIVTLERDQRDEWCQQVAILVARDALSSTYEFRRTEAVGPKIGSELLTAGLISVGLTLVAIVIYVWVRFEWQFGVGALVAMLHDVLTTVGLFAITQIEFNLAALAALLTIAGYSINDTVVVFDRVRENLRRYKKLSLIELLNVSTNETLSRTIMTSGTTALAILALVIFGGPVLHSFSIAMLWGIFVGTYSTIWIANGALVYTNFRPDRARSDDEKDGQDKTRSLDVRARP